MMGAHCLQTLWRTRGLGGSAGFPHAERPVNTALCVSTLGYVITYNWNVKLLVRIEQTMDMHGTSYTGHQ